MAVPKNVMQLTENKNFLTLSTKLGRIPTIAALLGSPIESRSVFSPLAPKKSATVIAWGRKPSAIKAEKCASRHGLPLLRLEDGFLRSVGLGNQQQPFSIVLDDVGIYYDAAAPSRLEQLISLPLTVAEQQRADALIKQWQQARVSKYNHSREVLPEFPRPFVLVVDQTFGDASIEFGLANATSFQQMLQSALETYPDHDIVLKIHPDVLAGKKRSHFQADVTKMSDRIRLLADDIHPPALLEKTSAVFCVTSQLGFEALLWQKPVYTFGMPFYAGWGLTHDALPPPSRRQPASIQQLVFAALLQYPRYLDPDSGELCQAETLLNWMARQRRERERWPAQIYAVGFSRWKRYLLPPFLQGSQLKFVPQTGQVPAGVRWLSWGSAQPAAPGLVRVEDGFIRSVGLGVELIKPVSWVFDDTGIYYDASAPSRLEHLLLNTEFSAELEQQAAALTTQLLQAKVTKYNVGQASWVRPTATTVLLVPGQVETDASIKLGSPVWQTNLQLLQQVRQRHPDSYILYKPHPDEQAGLRIAGTPLHQASQWCDEIVLDQDMAHLLTLVDEVHTLTSLTGFEALLRERKVVCYGQPFYAGWGLTEDVVPLTRRGRQLTINQLVAATLLLYPTYLDPRHGHYIDAQQAVTLVQQQRQIAPPAAQWWRPLLRLWLRWHKF